MPTFCRAPSRGPRRRDRRAARKALGPEERGAAAVEFGLILPLLVLLVFGIIEFGAAWSQNTDVRHGAREAGRLAAVNYDPLVETGAAQTATMVATACSRMGNDNGATVAMAFAAETETNIGDVVVVTVEQPFNSITGFVPISETLRSTIELRLERPATWAPTTTPIPC